MNQQLSSTRQASSSSVTVGGGGYQTMSNVYQVKEYQHEQRFGGHQDHVKIIPIQQEYSVQQRQQHNIQSDFNEFQIPIKKDFNQSSQNQSLTNSAIYQSQNQVQLPQQEQINFQNQGQYQSQVQIQQSGQHQGQPQAQIQPQVQYPLDAFKNRAGQFQGNQNQYQFQQYGTGLPQTQLHENQKQGPQNLHNIGSQQEESNYQQTSTEWPPKNEGGPNLTTTYPSSFKLKEEAPMDHVTGAQIVPSQPAFKITQPMKMRGDEKWPPKRGGEGGGEGGGDEISQEQVREFIKPKKGNRDYSEFFAQNALPNSYPAYRAPPGTQHHGLTEE